MSDERPTSRRTTPGRGAKPLDRAWRERVRVNLLWLTITLELTGLLLVVVLQLWRSDPHVPVSLGLDNEFSLMVIKNVLGSGWANHTSQLGAPFGQVLYDFPVVAADVLHLLVIKGIGVFTDDPALVMNCFYGLSFFLVSACAFVALRLLKISPAVASAVALLYSFLPYHFVRGGYFGQPTLSAYYAVPLTCALVIRQLGDEPLLDLRRSTGGRRLPMNPSRAALALAICVVGALTSVYYAVFAMILLAFAGLARALTVRSFRPLVAALALAGVMAATLLTALVPNLLYIERNGPNQDAARRLATESEVYGLKIVNLVLPTPEHRISALDVRPGEKSVLPGEGTETLGLIGAAGFIGLLLTAARRLLGSSNATPQPAGSMAALLLFTVLLGTVAGFSAVVANLGFTQIRAWSRISVFVAFLALGAVALVLDRVSVTSEAAGTAARRLGLSLLVLVVGIADQTTPSFVPRYKEVSRTWRSDQSFIQRVERRYGEADVFQLPIMPFPESYPVGKVWGSTHLRGYLHSDALRWSFGGMRGRESDWQDQLLPLPALDGAARVALAGFEALYIDRAGYPDRGVELEGRLEPYLTQRLVSSDGRLAVYDLRPLRRELDARLGSTNAKELGQLVLDPVKLRWNPNFNREERIGNASVRTAESSAEVSLVNEEPELRRVVFDFELDSQLDTGVVVGTEGRPQALRSLGGREGPFRLELSLPPGETKVRFGTEILREPTSFTEGVPRRNPVGYTAQPTGDTRFSVINPRVDEGQPDLDGLLRSMSPRSSPDVQVVPRPEPIPDSSLPPLLAVAGVLVWSVVFTAVLAECLRALLYPKRRLRARLGRSAL